MEDLEFGCSSTHVLKEIFLGKGNVVPGLLIKKKKLVTFTLLRAVVGNLANGKEIQIGYLDMHVTSAGQPKEVLIVLVLEKNDNKHQTQLMVLVAELLYMQHLQ